MHTHILPNMYSPHSPPTHPAPHRELQMELEERRKRWLASIDAVFTNLGQGFTTLLGDQTKLTTFVVGTTLLAGGVYGMREAARAGGKAFDQWFGTPRLVWAQGLIYSGDVYWVVFQRVYVFALCLSILQHCRHNDSYDGLNSTNPDQVRETSRRKPWQFWKRGPSGAGGSGSKTIEDVKKDFSDIVLPGGLQDTVRAMAAVTSNTRRHSAPFRHMLFYGMAQCLLYRKTSCGGSTPALDVLYK